MIEVTDIFRAAVAGLILGSSGCFSVTQLAPPPVPQQVLPAVDISGTPGAGLGRLVLDTVGESATVTRIDGGSLAGSSGNAVFAASLEVSREICVTPCVVDLPFGAYKLRFDSRQDSSRNGIGFANIGREAAAYRFETGKHEAHYGRRSLAWLTAGLAVFTGVGTVATINRDNSNLPIGYGITSVVFTGLSYWLFKTSPFIEQAGTGTQWTILAP